MRVRNVLSIDVEEWFHPEAVRPWAPAEQWASQPSHIEREVDVLLALLDEARIEATFFILGLVAQRTPAVVKRIAAAGHEVASHGFGHRMITEMGPQELREDLTRARAALEDLSGSPVIGYRAPTFSVVRETSWALDVIAETGHRYDASIYPIHHDRYGIPNAPRFPYRVSERLVELPGSTVRLLGTNVPVGGGGYLRLLPLAFNVAALEYLNRVERKPFVVYLHPWETDPRQPRLPVRFPRSLRHYHNFDRMLDRVRTLAARFPFAPARDVLGSLGLLG